MYFGLLWNQIKQHLCNRKKLSPGADLFILSPLLGDVCDKGTQGVMGSSRGYDCRIKTGEKTVDRGAP